jgi:hypothetical protein
MTCIYYLGRLAGLPVSCGAYVLLNGTPKAATKGVRNTQGALLHSSEATSKANSLNRLLTPFQILGEALC